MGYILIFAMLSFHKQEFYILMKSKRSTIGGKKRFLESPKGSVTCGTIFMFLKGEKLREKLSQISVNEDWTRFSQT